MKRVICALVVVLLLVLLAAWLLDAHLKWGLHWFAGYGPLDNISYESACALGQKGTPRAFSILVDALESPNFKVRSNAICGLGDYQQEHGASDELREVLVRAIGNRSEPVATSALCLLCARQGSRLLHDRHAVLAVARSSLKDSRPDVRGHAIYALERAGPDERDVAAVVSLLQDPAAPVRSAAFIVLCRLRGRELLPVLEEAHRRETHSFTKSEMERDLQKLRNSRRDSEDTPGRVSRDGSDLRGDNARSREAIDGKGTNEPRDAPDAR